MQNKIKAFAALFLVHSLSGPSAFALSQLVSAPPLALPGQAGRFDFMEADPAGHRILAAHTGAGTLEVIDLTTGKPLSAVAVGDAQGVAVDVTGRRYFLGNDKSQSIVVVGAGTLAKVSEIKLDGPVDAIAYDSKNGMVYAAKDEGSSIWIVDPKKSAVSGTIEIPGVPEVLAYDAVSDRIYLNIKDKDLVVRIDPGTGKIDAKWPAAPAKSPHGLAMDSDHHRLYTAGSNGKLVALDMKTGALLSSTDIPAGVDQIAFDPLGRRIYSACKGFIAVSEDSATGLHTIGTTPSAKGSHTLAVDPSTHDVWVSYSDESHSYVQKFAQVR